MGALSSVHPLESGGRTRRFGLVVGGHGRNFGQQLRWAGQSAIHHTAFPQGQKKVGVAKNGGQKQHVAGQVLHSSCGVRMQCVSTSTA